MTTVVASRATLCQSGLEQLLRKGQEKRICWGKALTGPEGLEPSWWPLGHTDCASPSSQEVSQPQHTHKHPPYSHFLK